MIKPNALELSMLTGLPTDTDAEVEEALTAVLASARPRRCWSPAAKGMSLGQRGQQVRHVRACPAVVRCLRRRRYRSGGPRSGPGGQDGPVRCGGIAVLASGVAVTKVGTAVVTQAEMIDAELAAHMGPAEARS